MTAHRKLDGGILSSLPTYIIIGAMKCGTTSLHRYLAAHPEIGASGTKELHFFSEHFAKGIDWYASQLDPAFRVRGEASPSYSKCHLFPGVPARMHSVVPDCKLIYIVREPIERAVSAYVHNVHHGRKNWRISEVFADAERSREIQTGRYLHQLRQFLEYYPRDRILVLFSDDLRDDRRRTLARAFRFLGVDDTFSSPEFDRLVHVTSKSKREHRWWFRPFRRFYNPNKFTRIGRMVTRPRNVPKLELSLLSMLQAFYAPENKALADFLGVDLPESWNRKMPGVGR